MTAWIRHAGKRPILRSQRVSRNKARQEREAQETASAREFEKFCLEAITDRFLIDPPPRSCGERNRETRQTR